MIITLKNRMGVLRECKLGFSWTTLFLGVFVPLFRKDWSWTLIMFLAALLTRGLSWLVFPFFYNKMYIKGLLKDGFRPATIDARDILAKEGYGEFDIEL